MLPTSMANNANSLSLLPPLVKDAMNAMSSMPGNLNMAHLNMNLQTGLSHMAMHNQLESMMNVSSPLAMQNNHMNTSLGSGTMHSSQQHSNGFSSMKRDSSPSSLLNNNGLSNLGMTLNMSGIGSIFDPQPLVMPMQMPQSQMKKDDKNSIALTAAMTQQQMISKMDGRWSADKKNVL